jgi:hypothetical protein
VAKTRITDCADTENKKSADADEKNEKVKERKTRKTRKTDFFPKRIKSDKKICKYIKKKADKKKQIKH